jgi:hypothetical protein
MTHHLDHIVLATTDIAAAAQAWLDALGLSVEPPYQPEGSHLQLARIPLDDGAFLELAHPTTDTHRLARFLDINRGRRPRRHRRRAALPRRQRQRPRSGSLAQHAPRAHPPCVCAWRSDSTAGAQQVGEVGACPPPAETSRSHSPSHPTLTRRSRGASSCAISGGSSLTRRRAKIPAKSGETGAAVSRKPGETGDPEA